MNFRIKLTIFMIVLMSLTIFTQGILNNFQSGRLIEEAARENAINSVLAETDTISGLLQKEKELPDYLSRDPRIIDFINDQASGEKLQVVESLLEEYYNSRSNLEGLLILNSDGIEIATLTSHDEMRGLDLSGRDYHKRTMETKAETISETLTSKLTGRQFFAITHPIMNIQHPENFAYIVTLVRSESMAEYLKSMKLGGIQSSYASLIDEKGNYIYTPQTEKIGTPVENPEIQRLVKGEIPGERISAATIAFQTSGEDMLAAYNTVPETGWLLVLTGSMTEAKEPVTRMNNVIILIAGILTAFATIVVFYATKFISQPVVEELKTKNHELMMLNEEIIASEEELRDQNDKLVEGRKILEEKNRILEVIMEASADGLWYINLKTGEARLSNRWLQDIAGYETLRLEPFERWEEFIHEQDKEKSNRVFMDYVEGRTSEVEDIYRVLDKNGLYRWIRIRGKTFYDKDGKPEILAGVQTDIDNLKKQEERLDYLAYHDVLTGLPNRFILTDRLEVALKASKRTGGKTAVMFIDIDDFKRINDSMGHNYGDELLKKIAERISAQIRECDTLVRFGGDEFVIVSQGLEAAEDLAFISERIKTSFVLPFTISLNMVYLSCSIGIAVYPEDGSTPEELLKHSDAAMYKAKASGKNNVQFFTGHMKKELDLRFEIERDLREAINNNEFDLHYQPQYDMKTGGLRGLEALVRWNRPDAGMVSPSDFIPVAEETGLIVPIGNWILQQACRMAEKWSRENNYKGIICINISAIQLRQPGFVDWVKRALTDTGIDPGKVELEITESIFIDFFDAAAEKLGQLQKLGVRISLDDFGTGYSSLAYLKTLPIQTLKIDRAFINEIKEDSSETKMLSSIIALVRNMDMETVAEGVETKEQFNYLRKSGCDIIQGYLASRPVREGDVPELIGRDVEGRGFNGIEL